MRQVFLDTETTGLSPDNGDRFVELGCVEMVNRRLTGQQPPLLPQPERPTAEEARAGCTA
jgi:DNA polymerase-3 subunit epsilon